MMSIIVLTNSCHERILKRIDKSQVFDIKGSWNDTDSRP